VTSRRALDADLAPVRDALLSAARADADAVLAEAARDVDEQRSRAEAEAGALLESARAQAAADAAVMADAARSRVLREARSVELRARRAAYDALVAAAADAVRAEVATDPDVVAALTRQARRAAGPDARLTPLPDGGMAAELGARTVVLSLTALVEGAVSDLLASKGAT
jgi:vacuolar-type H+-ATPase subunit E/Vma4